jgi:hypothetical protein
MKAPVICPKCNAPRAGNACPRCGLAANRMATYSGSSRAKVHDALIVPWRRTVDNWNDVSCHDELLSLAAQHDAFAWLAGQYSAREKDDVRDRALERLRKAAEAKMFATALQTSDKNTRGPYRSVKTIMVMLVGVLVLGLVLASLLAYVMPHPREEVEPAPSQTPASHVSTPSGVKPSRPSTSTPGSATEPPPPQPTGIPTPAPSAE